MQPYLQALAATLAIELGVVVLLAPWLGRARLECLAAVAALNLVTHPAATWLVGEVHLGWWPAEALVCFVEILGVRSLLRVPVGRSIACAGLCNLLSATSSWWW